MTASEDPATPLSTDAAGPAQPSDELEHWLRDLRTDVAADPPGWIETDPNPNPAPPASWLDPDPASPRGRIDPDPGQPEPSAPEPKPVGRHRSPD